MEQQRRTCCEKQSVTAGTEEGGANVMGRGETREGGGRRGEERAGSSRDSWGKDGKRGWGTYLLG